MAIAIWTKLQVTFTEYEEVSLGSKHIMATVFFDTFISAPLLLAFVG